jgi:mono/diheme cytochrome c family protein/plastocyanin
MNTSKQINVIVALIFLSLVATGAYWMWDPGRADRGKEEQRSATLTRGAYLFSQNCRVCHGNQGEGGAASNRLRLAPALNRPDLQGRASEGAEVDPQAKAQQFKFVFNTIDCGRVGKAMPTWGQANGGTLNDEQIRQLATFITEGDAWEEAGQFALYGYPPSGILGDALIPFSLAEPVSETATVIKLNGKISSIGVGDRLQIDDELMPVQAVDETAGTVTVERGFGTTNAAAHAIDAQLLKLSAGTGVPPEPPAITQAACGQLPIAAGPTPTPAPASATLTITESGSLFDQAELRALAGVELTITVDNKDDGVSHNWALYTSEQAAADREDPLFATEIEPGLVVQTLTFGPLEPGEYYYQCDVHAGTMFGKLIVEEAGAAPAAPAAGETPTPEATPAP